MNNEFALVQLLPKLMTETLRRREEALEIEREGVKLLIPTVSFECPELCPPRHPPVSGTVLVVKCVVQENSDD